MFLSRPAFVAREQEGLILEKPLNMGETRRSGYHLDIKSELKLVDNVKSKLMVESSPEMLVKKTMKELGLKRFGSRRIPLPFRI